VKPDDDRLVGNPKAVATQARQTSARDAKILETLHRCMENAEAWQTLGYGPTFRCPNAAECRDTGYLVYAPHDTRRIGSVLYESGPARCPRCLERERQRAADKKAEIEAREADY